MPRTKAQMLIKKRESERKRYEKIKNDPVLYAEYKQKNKEKYQRRKRDGKVINISQLPAREQTELRRKWREDAKKSHERKKLRQSSSRLADSVVNERMESPVSRRITRSFFDRIGNELRTASPRDSLIESDTERPENPGTSAGITFSNLSTISNPSSSASSTDTANEENSEAPLSSFAPHSPPSLTLSTDNAVDSFENQRSMNVTNRSREASPSSPMLTSDRSASSTSALQTPAQQLANPLESIIRTEFAVFRSQMRLMYIVLMFVLITNTVFLWIFIWYYILK